MPAITGTTPEEKLQRIIVLDYFNESNEITYTASRLLYRIYKLTNKFGYCFASNKTLSEILKLPERSIKRGVAELRNLGAITTVIDPKTSDRKIYIDSKVIVHKEFIADLESEYTEPEDGRPTSPGGDVGDTRGMTCMTPIIYNGNIVTGIYKQKEIKKNSGSFIFSETVPMYIQTHLQENLTASQETRATGQLIYTGKYDILYQVLSISNCLDMKLIKPYVDILPDETLRIFSTTLMENFNGTNDVNYRRNILSLAAYLLFKNLSCTPLDVAMKLPMNFTELSVERFSNLLKTEDNVEKKLAEVNMHMKTLSSYSDFPTAVKQYIAYGKRTLTLTYKNNSSQRLDKAYAVS